MDGTITPEKFSNAALEFIKASDEIGDNWEIHKKNDETGTQYLVCNRKINLNDQLFQFEYHVVYSVSYQVPVLFFKINRSDGSLVTVEEAWNIFKQSPVAGDDENSNADMYKILTQMEHPHLYVPFLALHPCRTAEILAINANSKNLLLTFLSTMGPFIHLNLHPFYGQLFN